MYHLFLDDERLPHHVTWVDYDYQGNVWGVVRNFDEFVQFIKENFEEFGLPKFISFDHDLAEEHYALLETYEYDDGDLKKAYQTYSNTGYACAKWLVEFCQDVKAPFPEYVVHSMNPVGKENIISYIENAKKVLDL